MTSLIFGQSLSTDNIFCTGAERIAFDIIPACGDSIIQEFNLRACLEVSE